MNYKKIVSFMLMFSLCVPMTTLNVTYNNTSMISTYAENLTTSDGLFEYSVDLIYNHVVISRYVGSDTSVVIPTEIDGYPVVSIGNDAFKDSLIESVTIPEGICSLGNWTFSSCSNLTSISLPKSVIQINDYTFYDCNHLESITLSDNIKYIGLNAFKDCTSLKSIELPSKISSINEYTFDGCKSLESVTIPSNVTSVKSRAFSNCTKLGDVFVKSRDTVIDDGAFYKSPNVNIIYDYSQNQPTDNNFKNGIYGDINGDGVANIIDLVLMKKIILEL